MESRITSYKDIMHVQYPALNSSCFMYLRFIMETRVTNAIKFVGIV